MSIDVNNPITGITSVNSQTGALTVAGAGGVTVTPSGSTVTVAATSVYASLFTKTFQNGTSRVMGTTYQNTTGKPMIVLGCTSPTGTTSTTTAVCDASSTPTTIVNQQVNNTGNTPFGFMVPNNDFYKISGSTFSLWLEYTINSGTVTFSGELSGSRSVGGIFQNTSGFAKFIVADLSGIASGVVITGISDANSSPTAVNWLVTANAAGNFTVWMIVPNNHYYKITASGAAVAHWNEYTLPFNAAKSIDYAVAPAQRAEATGANLDSQAFIAPIFTNLTGKDMFVALSDTNTQTGTFIFGSHPAATYIIQSLGQLMAGNNANSTSGLMIVQKGDCYFAGHDSGTAGLVLNHWWEYQLS